MELSHVPHLVLYTWWQQVSSGQCMWCADNSIFQHLAATPYPPWLGAWSSRFTLSHDRTGLHLGAAPWFYPCLLLAKPPPSHVWLLCHGTLAIPVGYFCFFSRCYSIHSPLCPMWDLSTSEITRRMDCQDRMLHEPSWCCMLPRLFFNLIFYFLEKAIIEKGSKGSNLV